MKERLLVFMKTLGHQTKKVSISFSKAKQKLCFISDHIAIYNDYYLLALCIRKSKQKIVMRH